MIALVPIKIIIRRDLTPATKKAKYPNLNLIDKTIRKGMGWSVYVDAVGRGLQYDKVENIGLGNETGACLAFVEEAFAEAAVSLFPDDVFILDEKECIDFWDNRSHVFDEEEHVDLDVLQKIKAKKDLDLATPEEVSAIDPGSPMRGIRKNQKKHFSDYKTKSKIKIKKNIIPSSKR